MNEEKFGSRAGIQSKMVNVEVALDLWEALAARARSEERSLSAVVRRALRSYLETDE